MESKQGSSTGAYANECLCLICLETFSVPLPAAIFPEETKDPLILKPGADELIEEETLWNKIARQEKQTEVMAPMQVVRLLPCGHTMCNDCFFLFPRKMKSDSCPSCKQNIV